MKSAKQTLLTLAIVAMGTLATSAAQADTLNLDGFAYSGTQAFSLVGSPRGNMTVSAGEFSGTLNGNSFQTFCLDLAQSISFNTAYSNYTLQSGSSVLGAVDADRLGKLYTNYIGSVTDATSSAAFQLAAWEVITETGSSLSLSGGSFYTTTTGTAVTLANTWLTGLDSKSSSYTIDVLQSNCQQDMLVATPVPEPETYAMMGAGLALMGAVVRRRRPAR